MLRHLLDLAVHCGKRDEGVELKSQAGQSCVRGYVHVIQCHWIDVEPVQNMLVLAADHCRVKRASAAVAGMWSFNFLVGYNSHGHPTAPRVSGRENELHGRQCAAAA